MPLNLSLKPEISTYLQMVVSKCTKYVTELKG